MLYVDSLGSIWNFELISKIKITQEPRDFEIVAAGAGLDDTNNCLEIFPTKNLAVNFKQWLLNNWQNNVVKISYTEFMQLDSVNPIKQAYSDTKTDFLYDTFRKV